MTIKETVNYALEIIEQENYLDFSTITDKGVEGLQKAIVMREMEGIDYIVEDLYFGALVSISKIRTIRDVITYFTENKGWENDAELMKVLVTYIALWTRQFSEVPYE